MKNLYQTLKTIETIARHPLYYLVGIAREKLIYLSNEEEVLDLWISNLDGGEKRRITHGGVFEVAKPHKEDKVVFYTRDVTKGREKHRVFMTELDDGKETQAFDMEPLRIFGLAVKDNFIIYSGSTEKDIGLYLAHPGEKATKLLSTDKFLFVTDTDSRITVGFGNLHGNPKSYEIFIYNHLTNEEIIYTPKEGSVNEMPKLYKDKVLFASNFEGNKKLYLYDPKKESIEEPNLKGDDYKKLKITDYIDFGVTDDEKIWFIGLSEARGYAYIDGFKVNHPEGTPGTLDVYGDYIYMHFSSLKQPQSIYRIHKDKWERVIGKDLPKEIRVNLGEVKTIRYKSYDGLEIPCIIFEANAPKPGPTIIFVHGGPWSYVGDYWRAFITSLVASGFHIVAPNFRGSTGYGEEFRLLDIGDPGGGDLMDVIYARKYAVDNGLASRVAIMGYSYGGYMTFLATTKEPDLWVCGVAGAGITDWEESYKLSDAIFRQFINILFAGNMNKLKDRSPITYIENLKAPLCIIHPQNDTRTPLKPVLEFCRKLLDMNRTFELHVLPDIGHVILKTDQLINVLYPAITFLNKHLKQ